jgi:hypothetical protein
VGVGFTGMWLRSNRFGKAIWNRLRLLVDPVEAVALPALDLIRLEPEGNLLLGALNAVGAVAAVATNIDGEVACILF